MNMPTALSKKQRLTLFKMLSELPLSQFLSIEMALNPPSSAMPGLDAPLGERTHALFQWLEGPTGCGLNELIELLPEVGIQLLDDSAEAKENKDDQNTLTVIFSGSSDQPVRIAV